jgi:hypothetical protein
MVVLQGNSLLGLQRLVEGELENKPIMQIYLAEFGVAVGLELARLSCEVVHHDTCRLLRLISKVTKNRKLVCICQIELMVPIN